MRAFLLLAAIPGREAAVHAAAAKVPGVLAVRELPRRVGAATAVAYAEASDADDLDKRVFDALRAVDGVSTVRRVMPRDTVLAPLQRVMTGVEREFAKK